MLVFLNKDLININNLAYHCWHAPDVASAKLKRKEPSLLFVSEKS